MLLLKWCLFSSFLGINTHASILWSTVCLVILALFWCTSGLFPLLLTLFGEGHPFQVLNAFQYTQNINSLELAQVVDIVQPKALYNTLSIASGSLWYISLTCWTLPWVTAMCTLLGLLKLDWPCRRTLLLDSRLHVATINWTIVICWLLWVGLLVELFAACWCWLLGVSIGVCLPRPSRTGASEAACLLLPGHPTSC